MTGPRPSSVLEPAKEEEIEGTEESKAEEVKNETAVEDDVSMQDIGLDGTSDPAPRPLKSPPLPSRRISTASLDEVSLDEVVPDDASSRSRSSTIRSNTSSRAAAGPSKDLPKLSTGHARKASVPRAPSVPAQSQTTTAPHLPVPSQAPLRKLTSPFSWLSRSTSTGIKDSTSPPPAPAPAQASHPERRNTSSSLATVSSNPDLMLNKLGDGHDSDGSGHDGPRRPGRNSLRDRFKMLRIREEAGITSLGEDDDPSPVAGSAIASLIGRGTGLGLGIGSPTSIADEKEGGLAASPAERAMAAAEVPSGALPTAVNPHLAPGTVAGISAGPSAMHDPAVPVDWDLWQSVVYEGPAAVARTSAAELNRAIASGIPSAIRGVVWQVLAQSKNEELESVYKDLLSRGTDTDRDRAGVSGNLPANHNSNAKTEQANGQVNGTGKEKEKESVTSSGSSTPSDHSTPGTSATNGIASPTVSHKDDVEAAKVQANVSAEKKKKVAEDAASLLKLEKAIKRDLGARTSYSKYAASAGLQESLFGVCKAYALFDEGVGYAQGMNFLIMPLLFNVSLVFGLSMPRSGLTLS